MEAGLPLLKLVSFFVYESPFIIAQIIPVAILLAVLIVFGLMTRNNEILALKSSGISIYYLLKPVLFIGLFMTIFLFFFSDIVVPMTRIKANQIWLREVRHESVISRERDIWLKDNRLITHIQCYDKEEGAIQDVTFNYFDENFRLYRRIDAKKGIFEEGYWVLYDLIEQVYDKESGKYKMKIYKERIEPVNLLPDDLRRVVKKSDEMTFKELLEHIVKIESEGYDATTYRVDLYAKLAFPFICVIMCLVGTGIAARGNIREGLPVSISYGIGITFLYWIFYSFCVSLGYGEMLPPIIAVWIANFVFLCVGILLLLNAE
jgi:lipopolysaccharide export system permease protein